MQVVLAFLLILGLASCPIILMWFLLNQIGDDSPRSMLDRERKRRSRATPYITVDTWICSTHRVTLAIPAKYAENISRLPYFHSLIQLPGAFIVR